MIGYRAMEQPSPNEEPETAGNPHDEQRAREREALRRRVSESLLRCPEANLTPRA